MANQLAQKPKSFFGVIDVGNMKKFRLIHVLDTNVKRIGLKDLSFDDIPPKAYILKVNGDGDFLRIPNTHISLSRFWETDELLVWLERCPNPFVPSPCHLSKGDRLYKVLMGETYTSLDVKSLRKCLPDGVRMITPVQAAQMKTTKNCVSKEPTSTRQKNKASANGKQSTVVAGNTVATSERLIALDLLWD